MCGVCVTVARTSEALSSPSDRRWLSTLALRPSQTVAPDYRSTVKARVGHTCASSRRYLPSKRVGIVAHDLQFVYLAKVLCKDGSYSPDWAGLVTEFCRTADYHCTVGRGLIV